MSLNNNNPVNNEGQGSMELPPFNRTQGYCAFELA